MLKADEAWHVAKRSFHSWTRILKNYQTIYYLLNLYSLFNINYNNNNNNNNNNSTFVTIMDLVKAVQHYVDKMVNEVPGMKAFLLDTDTVNDNFSIIFPQVVINTTPHA